MTGFVNRLVADRWNDVNCFEDEVLAPTGEAIKQAVSNLDANTYTLVTLYGPDGAYLCIGGGVGQYVVYISSSDEKLWNLVEAQKVSGDVILLNAGGQVGDFPAKQVIALDQALKAACTFFTFGELDSALQWELQE